MKRDFRIVGGGLAGLSLGVALARRGFRVKVLEAGRYPRHRVCGEFLSGVQSVDLQRLGIEGRMRGGVRLETMGWFLGGRLVRKTPLPETAHGLSRYRMDAGLAAELESAGGALETCQRVNESDDAPGTVWATGRRPTATEWIGLKAHVAGLPLQADLEMHLGRGGYAGANRVEDGRVNVCGLFRRRPGIRSGRGTILLEYLREAGCGGLADRIAAATLEEESATAVAGLAFGGLPERSERLRLGDHYAAIAPFTGNGMSMALESASIALEPLMGYGNGRIGWSRAVAEAQESMRRRFEPRLRWARAMHGIVLSGAGAVALGMAHGLGCLPMGALFRKTR